MLLCNDTAVAGIALADREHRWHAGSMLGYADFVTRTEELLFDSMASVQRLQFIADRGTQVGCAGQGHGMSTICGLTCNQRPD